MSPSAQLLRLRDEVLHIAARAGGSRLDDTLAAIRDRFHHSLPAQRPHVLLDIVDGLDATEQELRMLRRQLRQVAVDAP